MMQTKNIGFDEMLCAVLKQAQPLAESKDE
jgi:hypothetical protein